MSATTMARTAIGARRVPAPSLRRLRAAPHKAPRAAPRRAVVALAGGGLAPVLDLAAAAAQETVGAAADASGGDSLPTAGIVLLSSLPFAITWVLGNSPLGDNLRDG